MNWQRHKGSIFTLAMIVLALLVSSFVMREKQAPKPQVPPFSMWGVEIGMTPSQVNERLNTSVEPDGKTWYFCAGCKSETWTGRKPCELHVGGNREGSERVDEIYINWREGKSSLMGCGVLERDGKIVLRVGDSKEALQEAFPDARFNRFDDWATTADLFEGKVLVNLYGDKVAEIMVNDRAFVGYPK